MKTKTFLFLLVLSFFVFNANAQINVDCNGKVGIGLDPIASYDLTLNSLIFRVGGPYSDLIIGYDPLHAGNLAIYPTINNNCTLGTEANQFYSIYGTYHYANTTLLTSDKRLKENFRSIEKPLDKLLQMSGQKYDFISQGTNTIKNENEKQRQTRFEKDRLGFVAQDLEKILPEAVFYFKDEDRYYVDYNAVIPVIVEAMKEQQAQIEELKSVVASCCTANLKNAILITNAPKTQANGVNKLYQNTPNPFLQNTTIGYSLTENVQKAMICIYDMNGKQLKCTPLELAAHGNIIINSNEFKAGMYMYSLIVDEQLIDTKRMILTD